MSNPVRYRHIIALSIPVIFANIAVPIQGLIDVAIIGHLDSPHYLSAVGVATQVFLLLLVSFNFLQYASSGLAAQATGEQNIDKLKRVLQRALLIAGVIGVSLIVLQHLWIYIGRWFFDVDTGLAHLFAKYIHIRIWGAPIELANYAFIGWFAGQGKPQYLLRQQLAISVSNVIFNLVFVVVLELDVAGVALGTALAHIVGFSYALTQAKRLMSSRDTKLLAFDWQKLLKIDELLRLMQLNRDIMIRSLILTLSLAWITRLSSQQGEMVLAVNVVLMQLLFISAHAIDGIAVTTESLVGQAYGRGDMQYLHAVVKRTTATSFAIAGLVCLMYVLIQPVFIWLMTDIEEVAIAAAEYYWFAAFVPLFGVLAYQFDGVMFGLTANDSIRNSMILVAVIFFPLSYALAASLGNNGIWLGLYAFLGLRGIILLWHYRKLV